MRALAVAGTDASTGYTAGNNVKRQNADGPAFCYSFSASE